MSSRDTSRQRAGSGYRTGKWLNRWAPLLLWMLLIFIGTAWPGEDRPFSGGGIDKIGHLLAYAILALLAYRFLLTSRKVRPFADHAWRVGLFGALYGLALELYQISVPGRDFQWSDVAANCLGIALALLILLYWDNTRSTSGPRSVGDNR